MRNKILLFGVLGIFLGCYFSYYGASSSQTTQFYIDKPFESVRKTLVRTNAKDRITEELDGKIISTKWEETSFSIDKIINANWELKLAGLTKIKSRDLNKDIEMKQLVYVSKNYMFTSSRLIDSSNYLQQYVLMVELKKCENKTLVNVKLDMEVCYFMGILFKRNIDEGIVEEVKNRLSKMEGVFDKVIKECENEKITIKLKM